MTAKEVKQWLGRARSIDKELRSLEKAVREERERATRITANYGGEQVGGSKDPHKLDRLAEYSDMVLRKQTELLEVKKEITEMILSLEDGRQRVALIDYYTRGLSWEEVAAGLHYSWRYTMQIRKTAIEAIGRKLSEAEN